MCVWIVFGGAPIDVDLAILLGTEHFGHIPISRYIDIKVVIYKYYINDLNIKDFRNSIPRIYPRISESKDLF